MFANANGCWCKKIKGKPYYFGSWRTVSHNDALKRYWSEAPAIQAGKTPKRRSDDVQLRDLLNDFLRHKEVLVTAGDLSARHVGDLHQTCRNLAGHLGTNTRLVELESRDFESLRLGLAKRLGPTALRNELTRIRSVFSYGVSTGLLERPPLYGIGFKGPSQKSLRKARNARGSRIYSPAETRLLIESADDQFKAILLLCLSCAFGNSDISNMPRSSLSADGLWVNYPRPKTEIPRRAPLWAEAKAAIERYLPNRPRPAAKEFRDLLFLTRNGTPWVRATIKTVESEDGKPAHTHAVVVDALAHKFAKLAKGLKLNRPGLGLYGFRRAAQTAVENCGDMVAVDHLLGHVPHVRDMGSVYRDSVADVRLEKASQAIRDWLYSG